MSEEMAAPVEVRPAVLDDVRAIGKLWSELQVVSERHQPSLRPHRHGEEWYREFIEMQCLEEAAAVLVAEVGGEVVGYILSQVLLRPTLVDGRIGFIADVCVTSRVRGRGIGTRLYSEAVRWFKKRGVQALEVNVVFGSGEADDFWSGKGFKDVIRTLRLELEEE